MSPEVALLILKVLSIVGAGQKLAPELKRKQAEYIAQIELMVREGRGPSDAELNALIAEGDELTAAIVAARDARTD